MGVVREMNKSAGPNCFSGDGDINDGKLCDEREGGQGLRME